MVGITPERNPHALRPRKEYIKKMGEKKGEKLVTENVLPANTAKTESCELWAFFGACPNGLSYRKNTSWRVAVKLRARNW